MRTIRVGLIGLGTVGSGVVEILTHHGEDFRRRAGVDIELARFADRTVERFADLGLAAERCSADWHDVVADDSLDIVIELIGGTGVAREVVLGRAELGQERRHRQQGAACEPWRRGHAGRRCQRRRRALRGERRWRHPHHRPAQALTDQQRDPDGHGHRQRHHQLHAHAHGLRRTRLRRRLSPRHRRRASPRPTPPPTSTDSTPRPRSRSCAR